MTIDQVLHVSDLEQENKRLREAIDRTHGYGEIIGRSPAMVEIYAAIGAFDSVSGRHVAEYASAEQPEHLDRVLGPHEIGVPDDQQRRRCDRPDVVGREVLGAAIHLSLLRE